MKPPEEYKQKIKRSTKKIVLSVLNNLGYTLMKKNTNDLKVYYKLFGENAVKNKKFYNIGAGAFRHPAWTNVNHDSDSYYLDRNNIDINFDLMSLKQMPIKSDSAFIVYTSHTIEHITNESAQNTFNETYRILKKGGIFRVTMPNVDLAYRAFKENDIYFYNLQTKYHSKRAMQRMKLLKSQNKPFIGEFFLLRIAGNVSPLHEHGAKKRFTDKELKEIFSNMKYEDALDFIISHCSIKIQKENPGNHINWWNFNKLKKMLEKAGFTKIYLSGYGQSFSPVLRNTFFFDNTAPELSLYVEAFK